MEVVRGKDGSLYGASLHGGKEDWGIIFKISRDGSGYTILHHFQGPDPARERAVAEYASQTAEPEPGEDTDSVREPNRPADQAQVLFGPRVGFRMGR